MSEFNIIANSEQIAKPLCEIFGLDASKVVRLNIQLNAGEPAIIEVCYFSGMNNDVKIANVFKNYHLIEVNKLDVT